MKGLSQYMSALILLLLSMIGMGLVAMYSMHMKNTMQGLISNSCEAGYSINYIDYSNGYVYLYNSGPAIQLRSFIEVLNGDKWINTTVAPRGSIFRIHSSDPVAILVMRNGCILVIRP